jgi:hypothetical protein
MCPAVAVVVPVYRDTLLPDEEHAIRHLREHLSRYDCFQISPKSLKLRLDGLRVRKYDNAYFTDVSSYSRLMLSKPFYQGFAEYDYILIYQLDCLVFRDELDRWCDQGFDYIGAPWFRSKDDPSSGLEGVGNGGLSLRRIAGFLKVFDSQRYISQKVSRVHDFLTLKLPDTGKLGLVGSMRKRFRVCGEVRRGVRAYLAHYSVPEDRFWGERARCFCPEFRVAPVDIALRFAFDWHPKFCFEMNGRKLPFGCHGWYRLGRDFWEPHLIKF